MDFQPSIYSREPGYDGWASNLFSKEGRAENKSKRAERKRKAGKTKSAERLERRAGVLKAKASGARMLTPQNASYKALWEVEEPWVTRMRFTGAGLDGSARGYRPSRTQTNAERRATIIGGIAALSIAGIAPWSEIDSAALPQKMVQGAGEDAKLIAAVEQGSGSKPGSLREAAEKVRQVVADNDLSAAAWPARALVMLATSSKRAKVTQAAAGATSAGTGMAAAAVAGTSASPPWVQSIVTLPAAAILGIISAVTAVTSGAAQIEGVRAKKDIEKYTNDFMVNLDKAGYRVQARALKSELSQETAKLQYQEVLAVRVGEAQAAEWTEAGKILAMAGGVSLALVATSLVIRKVRRSA